MIQQIRQYFSELIDTCGHAWNRFWFAPGDALVPCIMRILVGVMAIYFLASHTADLVRWFGPDGLLPFENVLEIDRLDQNNANPMRWSYLALTDSPSTLWALHVAGIAVLLAFTLGVYTRITAVASLVVLLSYVHRAPPITGQLEPVLTMMVFYLCLAPCGRFLSIDAWRASRKAEPSLAKPGTEDPRSKSLAANIAVRLMQIHLSLFYLTLCLSKLAAFPWLDGGAAWVLIAMPNNSLVDLQFLHQVPYLVWLWTHMIPLFEGSFALLIWVRPLRPLVYTWALVMWISLALISGLVSFAVLMLVAGLVFVSPATMRSAAGWVTGKLGIQADLGDGVTQPAAA